MKKSISVALAVLLLCSLFPAFASAAGIEALRVNPYGGAEDAMDAILWHESSGTRFLFLPADTDPAAAKVYFTASGAVTLDGAPVVSGGTAAAFTEGTHTLACGGRTYPLTVCFSSAIPTVFLTTESGSLDYLHADKNNKEPGSIRVYENGEMTLDSALKQIKGRGNATWQYAKKPYNIKFDKKTALLGMPKAKKWTLLAGHYEDPSLLKNSFALDFGRSIGLPETSECRLADVYANGGYLGVYLICESVEVGANRVEIADLDDANEAANPTVEDLSTLPRSGVREGYVPGSRKWIDLPQSPEDITGGYLLEVDYLSRYHAEASGFISDRGMPIVISSPEYASEAETAYISGVWNAAEEALYSDSGRNAAGKHFTECFDMNSLVKCYIAEELTKDVDSGITSFYFYKKAGDDKLYAGPLWDFDHAMGSDTVIGDRLTVSEPDTWYANQLRRNSIDKECWDFPTFFAQCYQFGEFREAVSAQWTGAVSSLLEQQALPSLRAKKELLLPSAVMNHLRWNTYGTGNVSAVTEASAGESAALLRFLTERRAALDKGFAPDGALVVYSANGGSGKPLYDGTIYRVGETAAARSNDTFTREGFRFAGWNTAPDGTGVSVAASGRFTVPQAYTVLYAQWEENKPEEGKKTFLQRLLDFFNRIAAFFRRLFGITSEYYFGN